MSTEPDAKGSAPVERLLRLCLANRLVVALLLILAVGWGLRVAPFDWDIGFIPRDPVPVDAIPDLGENQQIVFTEWPGRSPQDIEDQLTYPLTVALLGVPGVKNVRSQSMFGFSTINVIFEEGIEFYWSRTRILEKLNSLPAGALPDGVTPALGPDATGLGQVFWYTLEGRDPDGNPAGGWDPQELRSVQDWHVRFALQSAEGISEVASVGGFVKEYQIDVDPDAMRAYGVTLAEVFRAVQESNLDVGARTIEVNRVEYLIRGLGFLKSLEDIENTAIVTRDGVPVTIGQVARASLGPALRIGAIDKDGAEAAGGVVVVRFGENPLQAIQNVKAKIDEIAPGLPAKAVVDYGQVTAAELKRFAENRGFAAFDGTVLDQDAWLAWLRGTPREEWPSWITRSQVTVVPFYDRTGLIRETLGTLEEAISLQILITIIVVLVMMRHIRASFLISAILPAAVLLSFIGMKFMNVDANIVALSGIAIAIGTVVDMAVILCENILRRFQEAPPGMSRGQIVYDGAREVGGAVATAIATTVVSFLPVFTMIGAEGKLFTPLAYTKTFALIASVLLALVVLPVLAQAFLLPRFKRDRPAPIAVRGGASLLNWGLVLLVGYALVSAWMPLGHVKGIVVNVLFVGSLIGGLLLLFTLFLKAYPLLLRFFLRHKALYLAMPAVVMLFGLFAWLGAGTMLGWLPDQLRQRGWYGAVYHAFPGLSTEFMPALDEGSFLFMPTTMPHAGMEEALEVMRLQDMAFAAIPEVDMAVGKIGRVESPLDPAPVSMFETVINYKPEYILDERGRPERFEYDWDTEDFVRDEHGDLIPDRRGLPYRQWRDHIRSPDDIWHEILEAGEVPGTTSAPKLQPIMTRIIMLQTGMRANMGVKVRGPDLETIEAVSIEIEAMLREVPGVSAPTVFAERIVGKPYLEIDIDRKAIGRYGVSIDSVQHVIQTALGGMEITMTVEGRERYPVRVRYPRELRGQIEDIGRILVPAQDGAQVPLEHVAEVRYTRGPMSIKSEDTFLVNYITFDKTGGVTEVEVVERARAYLEERLDSGAFSLPPGVSYTFAGNYENQLRAARTLRVVLPMALFIIFMFLFLQFRAVSTTLLVFCGIALAWSGGFALLWAYNQPWFLDFAVAGVNLRDLFQIQTIALSVAIWVGFLALFGIATDDGVVIATYLDQTFAANRPKTRDAIREAVLEAGLRRIRPCLMTTATTLLALLPILTSTGRGADIMIPMAIPSFGGMAIALLTLFLVPVLYCSVAEWRLWWHETRRGKAPEGGIAP